MLNNVVLPGRKTVIAVMLSVKCAKTWGNVDGAGFGVADHGFMVLMGWTYQVQRYCKKPYFTIV